MKYNNFYPAQAGLPSHQHSGELLIQQSPGPIIQGPRLPNPSGHPGQHQMQPQHVGHNPQMQPQQHIQQANYHQIPNSAHPSHMNHAEISHPHQRQQQQQETQTQAPLTHNHHSPMVGPQEQIHHTQSPHHHTGPSMHIQAQIQSQQQNHVSRPVGPSNVGHQHSIMQVPPQHQQNFFNCGPPGGGVGPSPPQPNLHYTQNQNHTHPPPPHQHQHHHHPPPMAHQNIPSNIQPQMQQGFGRNSPLNQPLLQTEARIMELNRRLQVRPIPNVSPLPNHHDDHPWWDRFASEFFDDDATLTIRSLQDKSAPSTIGRTLIPRFFKTYFDGGATDLYINIRNPRETLIMNNVLLDCDACIITNTRWRMTEVDPGAVIHSEGQLSIEFVYSFDSLLIKSWKFFTRDCKEFLNRDCLNRIGSDVVNMESLSRSGLSKPTSLFLTLCKVIEPMQELMSQHKMLGLPPKECLRKYLSDKYKFCPEESRVAHTKRRKRKPSAVPSTATTNNNNNINKRSRMNMTNGPINNNNIMSPSLGKATHNFTLASQDVMVVGEPSMMGGDFGDDNERMITRLENSQYEPMVHQDESNSMTNITTLTENNGLPAVNKSTNLDSQIDSMSPCLPQQLQSQENLLQTEISEQDQQSLPLRELEASHHTQPEEGQDPEPLLPIPQELLQDCNHITSSPQQLDCEQSLPQSPDLRERVENQIADHDSPANEKVDNPEQQIVSSEQQSYEHDVHEAVCKIIEISVQSENPTHEIREGTSDVTDESKVTPIIGS